MSPVGVPPTSPMPVLLFRGKAGDAPEFLDAMDDLPMRDERMSVGFWDGHYFRENGTGHEADESWTPSWYRVTHWMPLPIIPAQGIEAEGRDPKWLGSREPGPAEPDAP